jgi:hypothetical protein
MVLVHYFPANESYFRWFLEKKKLQQRKRQEIFLYVKQSYFCCKNLVVYLKIVSKEFTIIKPLQRNYILQKITWGLHLENNGKYR